MTAQYLAGLTAPSRLRITRTLQKVLKMPGKSLEDMLDFLKESTVKFHWKQWKMAVQMTNTMLEKVNDDDKLTFLLSWPTEPEKIRTRFRRACQRLGLDTTIKLGAYDKCEDNRDQYRQTSGAGKMLSMVYALRDDVESILMMPTIHEPEKSYFQKILSDVQAITQARRRKYKKL